MDNDHPHRTRRAAISRCRDDFAHRRLLSGATDEELLHYVRRGHPSAFEVLYVRHYAAARRYARAVSRRYLGRDLADDLVAEAVRKILTALDRGHGPRIGFRQYLFTAVRSVALATRAAREEPVAALPDAPWAPRELDGEVELVRAAFRQLPPRAQQVLWGAKVSELDPRELAPQLGVSAQQAALLSFRARDALRVAFVRAHLPERRGRECDAALDLLARQPVHGLSMSQARRLLQHLDGCVACRRDRAAIRDEVAGWARHRPGVAPAFTPPDEPHCASEVA